MPITEFKEQIVELVKQNLFCIITGETGSGKSTQIAQFLVDGIQSVFTRLDKSQVENMIGCQLHDFEFSQPRRSDRGDQQQFRVVVTQPRRVAAIQMAKRVSFERSCKMGEQVGYTVRFDDCSNDKT